ncbi:MAG TPA: hypothetical protein VGF48_01850 [Thermoanaerobaculia bacterium]|jgi:hypothetical protein
MSLTEKAPITLTQSIVDIADCNVTLRYFSGSGSGTGTGTGTMPLSGAESYGRLYEQIARMPQQYQEVFATKGTILNRLRAFYAPNKFWTRYLSSDLGAYADLAWGSFVPISATIVERVEVVLPPHLAVITVSPEPRVLLYPFGWSTWLSLRITGSYSLGELAGVVSHLLTEPAYRYVSQPQEVMNLTHLMSTIGKGVKADAFGENARVTAAPDLLTVTTVLAKKGGGVSLGALDEEQEQALLQLIRPGKAPIQNNVKSMSEALPLGGDPLLDYVLHDDLTWFLWVEHLLKPQGRLMRNLRCYHNNTFRSLLQAWFFQTLFKVAGRTKPWTPELTALVDSVVTMIGPSEGLNEYKNRSLLSFLAHDDFQKPLAIVKKRLAPPAAPA